MKLLYLDCGMGAAGDMLAASLLALMPDPEKTVEKLNQIGIPHTEFLLERGKKCGIQGLHLKVLVHGTEEDEASHDHHSDLSHIREIVAGLALPGKVKLDVLAVYQILGLAESQVHGMPVSHIHFHEVGTLDAVADISAVCLLMDALAPDRIVVSPVHVGSGQVRCAHGILPVPAPATAQILTGVPIYSGEIQGELCTPTGAALLKYFADSFGPLPSMTPEKIGYGLGKKDFPRANCLRAIWGNAQGPEERILELACNLDDMTPEQIGFATGILLERGALDVWTTPIYMKKNRPAVILQVLCTAEKREELLGLLFRHTTTLGVREKEVRRHTLSRRTETLQTPYGPLRVKCAKGFGAEKRKPEFEDLARFSRETGRSIPELLEELKHIGL